jgi:hypothetical protein
VRIMLYENARERIRSCSSILERTIGSVLPFDPGLLGNPKAPFTPLCLESLPPACWTRPSSIGNLESYQHELAKRSRSISCGKATKDPSKPMQRERAITDLDGERERSEAPIQYW